MTPEDEHEVQLALSVLQATRLRGLVRKEIKLTEKGLGRIRVYADQTEAQREAVRQRIYDRIIFYEQLEARIQEGLKALGDDNDQ